MEYVGLFSGKDGKRLYFKAGEENINITLPSSVADKLGNLASAKNVSLNEDVAGFVKVLADAYKNANTTEKELLSRVMVGILNKKIGSQAPSQEQTTSEQEQTKAQTKKKEETQGQDGSNGSTNREIKIKELKETPKGRYFLATTTDGRKFYIDSSKLSEKFWGHLKGTNFKGYVLTNCKFTKSNAQSGTYFLASCSIKNTETGKEYSYPSKSKTEMKQSKKESEAASDNSDNSSKRSYSLRPRNR